MSSAIPRPPLGETDPSRWRLDSTNDRHVWHYIREGDALAYEEVWGSDDAGLRQQEQNDETKYWEGLPLPEVEALSEPNGDPYAAAKKGFEFYKRLQAQDGHWAGGELVGARVRPRRELIVQPNRVRRTSFPLAWHRYCDVRDHDAHPRGMEDRDFEVNSACIALSRFIDLPPASDTSPIYSARDLSGIKDGGCESQS